MPPIFVEIVLLAQLFSDQFLFNLPWYQRAYAWSTEHAVLLLEDVREASENNEWYHLGTVVLGKAKKKVDSAIIDGQQRIVTLTILFAVLRDLTSDEALRAELNERIWVTADRETPSAVLRGLARSMTTRGGLRERMWPYSSGAGGPTARLSPDDTITDVLRTFVQEDGATAKPPSDAQEEAHNESQKRVIANRDALREALKDVNQKELSKLARHLLERCYLVVEALEDHSLAAKIFRNAQIRGMDLETADLGKVSILNHVEPEARDECGAIWGKWAAELGQRDMEFLLHRLRDIKLPKAPDGSLETELIATYGIENNARTFIADTLAPMAERFTQLRAFSIGDGQAYDVANRRLQYLSLVNSRNWLGPALHFIDAHQGKPDQIEEFLIKLERFAFIHMIGHTDTRVRDRAYYKIISAIDKGAVLKARSPINLSKKTINFAVTQLRMPNFINNKWYKTLVLQRVDGAVVDGSVEGGGKVAPMPFASAEHILPKGAGKRSQWHADFTARNKPVNEWCQRFGNGTLLSLKDNGRAGSKDFIPVKRDIYANSEFALTRLLASEEGWNDKKIQERTEWMIDLLLKSWGLKK